MMRFFLINYRPSLLGINFSKVFVSALLVIEVQRCSVTTQLYAYVYESEDHFRQFSPSFVFVPTFDKNERKFSRG